MEKGGTEIFEKLMPYRIKKVLVVASLYDSFMFIDDDLFEQTVTLNYYLREEIKVERAKDIDEAKRRIEKSDIDLALLIIQSADFDIENLMSCVKTKNIPFVILGFNLQDINSFSNNVKSGADYIFLWQGDTRIFSSIINIVEDKINLQHDLTYGVQCVMLVEDNIRFYSMYLPIIYNEMIKQMHLVIADDMDISRKTLRIKARPKIVLFNNYDDAWSFFNQYSNNLLGIITDVEYPSLDNSNEKAGLLLVKRVKERFPDMPVLVQSSNQEYEKKALELGSSFLNKNSPDLSRQLRNFITRYFGFGDFVFDDGTGKEIARASDIQSMIKMLKVIPEKSLLYHASRNHFSKWLLARTEFDIAYEIRPKKIEEFSNVQDIRNYLIDTISRFIYKTHLGSVLRFDKDKYNKDVPFAKIGNGSIGGKARGLAFLNYLIAKNIIPEKINDIKVLTPNSVVIASDVFDYFLDYNSLEGFITQDYSEEKLAEIFDNINLPNYIEKDIQSLIEKINGPIAIRSSSLLEDSKGCPFAGIYKTYMVPKLQNDRETYQLVEKAIKYVYASAFSTQSKEFRRMKSLPDEEKMAVIIQEVVGRQYIKGYFFPLVSGVIQSYNYYPVYPFSPNDPIVHIALGLGEVVVSGEYFLRYSPLYPSHLHQLATIKDTLKNSQKKISVISLDKQSSISYSGCLSVKRLEIDSIIPSDEMKILYSTYIPEEERIIDGYHTNGVPLITMSGLIKNDVVNFNETVKEIVSIITDATGGDVEIEFAFNLDFTSSSAELYLLQVRSFSKKLESKFNLEDKNTKKLISSKNAIGNAYITSIQNVLFVKRDRFNNLITEKIVTEISKLNAKSRNNYGNYLLIGPGRWGTNDKFLGIPVKWNDISMAGAIVEAYYEDFYVEPSYGTHFFHNIVAMNIPYFTISKDDFIDWRALEEANVIEETEYTRLVRFPKGIIIIVQERKGDVFIKI